MINNSDKSRDKPSIYIDTCIARDVTATRNADSIELMTRIKREGWACSISIFGLMELIGIEKEDIFIRRKHYIEKATLDELISARRNLDLKSDEFEKCYQYIQQFMDNYSFVEIRGLDNDGWSLAAVIATNCNLHATDVIHLATAWQADCDIIVTNDTFFIKEAARYLKKDRLDSGESTWSVLRVCEPKNCYSVLKDMGYANIV